MPTSREVVTNKPLAGSELQHIILADVERLLASNGFLAGQSAYGQVAYEVRLTLHLNLLSMPTVVEVARSRTAPDDKPELAALAPLPLPSPDAVLDSTELHREIQSPNLARIEHSLPIEVTSLDQDGHAREQLVHYQPSDVGLTAEDFKAPDISDLTPEMRKELGL